MGHTPSALGSAAAALSDIKIAHSVFALPFALLGAFLAAPAAFAPAEVRPVGAWRAFAGQLGLVVGCMVFARTWAMLVNRLADRGFDAANPRTARRAFASGRVSVRAGWVCAACAAGLFVGTCAIFWAAFGNPWPLALSLPTLAWVAFYSFTKRFTALAHFFLGGALGVSPIAAAIAVRPGALADTPALWMIAAMVAVWVAGFDVLYAMQDLEFDRGAGLRSVPARLGRRGAAWVSRALHGAAVALLVGAWLAEPRFGGLFLAGAAMVGALLVAEHLHLSRKGLPGLPIAFGLINGVVSVTLGAAAIADLLIT